MARPRRENREESGREIPSDTYVSKFYVDPSFIDTKEWHYAFVETHCMGAETHSVEQSLMKGYEPVRASDIPSLAKHSEMMVSIRGRGQKDDFIRKGDQILMRCPMKLWEQRDRDRRKENKRMTEKVDWASQAQAIGAPTFVADKSYSRTSEKVFSDDE